MNPSQVGLRWTGRLVSHLLSVTVFMALVAWAFPPGPSGLGNGWLTRGGSGGGGNGWGDSSGKPARGSQVYLQDPWMHEHNYHKKPGHKDVGPHSKHGWGWGGTNELPQKATYIQQLYPVLTFGSGLKKLHSVLKAFKPSHHLKKWQAPAVAFFDTDGSPHHVSLQNNKEAAGGTYETNGWSYNHGSHHIGHKVPDKPSYATW